MAAILKEVHMHAPRAGQKKGVGMVR